MTISARYYDLGVGEEVSGAIIGSNGDEIAFDLNHSDGYRYTVRVKRVDGTLFKGTAISQPDGEIAELTCRVYSDPSEGLTMIAGSGWRYPGDKESSRWHVELQNS
ncbi:Uncharacterised protein [Pseudomonas luteola]|uniref:Uncharacterized protein n=1 Tax=Pseudomonas luteola TaxID=47886 RepID=A0A2X2BY27_PSELU|nr:MULTISPECIES: hypothetical protein [Pseudomonas]MBA1250164.1 hypothetical protein [Pseudomonas zeshuii]MBH3440915.1 hypothetical protein [Pseudomonas luteola]SPY99984.1 Uncharacterised protein [Pseudomonas luteola]